MPRLAVAVALSAAFAPAAAGLDPGRAITQYVQQAWSAEHGLPQNTVLALCQTRDGYVWVGTQEGLARFDGVRFTVFDRRNTEALGGNTVTALLEDRAGNLWIGVRGAGLVRYRDGHFEAFGSAQGLPDLGVRALYEDRAGRLWVGTSRGGLSRFRDGRFETFTRSQGLAGDQVVALREDRAGTLWIGTFDGGLSRFRDGAFTTFDRRHGLSDDKVSSIFEDRQGRLWVGTFGGGLNRIEGGRVTTYSAREGLSSAEVWAITEDRDGNLWVATDGGLNRFDGRGFTALRQRDGLASDLVSTLLEDREGGLWVGTQDGLARLGDGRMLAFGRREGLSEDVALGVFEDSAGQLWVGTDGGGVNRIAQGRVSTFTRKEGLADDHAVSIAEDAAGDLWVGTFGGGLHRFSDGRFTRLGAKSLPSEVVPALHAHGDDLWIGTDAGLVRRRGGQLETFTTADGLVDNHVITIHGDRAGAVWVGTVSGLARFHEGRFRAFGASDGWPGGRVVAILEDSQGTLWFGTSGHGLIRHRDGRFQAISSTHGLFDDRVFAVLEDGAGHLWMSSNRGLSRVRRDDLEAVAAGRRPRLQTVTSYGLADGMRSVECNGEFQPAGWRRRDGRLVFATVAGIVEIDPTRQRPQQPPTVVIEDLLVDGTSFRGQPQVPAGGRRVDLHYAALSFADPARIAFRHRMHGFDDDWVDAGAERAAHYTRLAPGDYLFRVEARNPDGAWSAAAATIAFRVPPLLHQTRGFQAAVALALMLAGAGAQRLRMRALRARAQRLQDVVDQRTADLRAANEQLREVQAQLARLSESRPDKLEDVAGWGAAVAPDIARAVGARRIDVWRAERGSLVPLAAVPGARAPEWSAVEAARSRAWRTGASTLVPVVGPTGELRGALTVADVAYWGETERQLVQGFADHLGGALDLQHLRDQLTATESRQAAVRANLRERGIATLKLCVQCGHCDDEAAERCPHDGSFLDGSRLVPRQVGLRYRLERLLGEGGMGQVFAARDLRLEREVAVKVIRAEALGTAGARFRIEREARVMANLRHPSVASVFDVGELEGGSAFLVMELLAGRDLADVVGNFGPGTPKQVARLLRQAGSALAQAHRAGVIHRDVKPANLFLVRDGEESCCKVLDFGLAKSATSDVRLTQTGIIVGTPGYMSPEQVDGRELDARSDLYSLAAVAYEALTGQPVIPVQEFARTLVDVLYRKPALASTLLPGLPPEVDAALASALEKQPEQRPEDVEAWSGLLADRLSSLPSTVAGWPPGFADVPRRKGPAAAPETPTL